MNIFQTITGRKPQKSSFDLTHNRKFSFAPGMCYPILCQETIPGDKWNCDHSALVRFMPTIAPIMHMVDVCAYDFAVPMRLCMKESYFETFITGGPNGDGQNAQGETPEIPYAMFHLGSSEPGVLTSALLGPGTLSDYLGVSLGATTGGASIPLNMMPFIAFWRVWCEYFRDQNLHPDFVGLYPGIFQEQGNITPQIFAALTAVGANNFPFFDIPQVCWEKDYFTSALPFAQRGAPVETPLTGAGTVTYLPQSQVVDTGTDLPAGDGIIQSDNGALEWGPTPPAGAAGRIENVDEVEVTTVGFTINALRVAARLQEWLEKMARGGARYIEQMKSQFGVTSSDARLQRTEYLGGGKIPVHISEVLQTSENGTTPLGEMAGHGVAAGKVSGFGKFFEEHCLIISVMFLRPRTAYQQGTPRLFTHRFDKLNWAWPSFAHLGEQEIADSEIFMDFTDPFEVEIFGYQQRYAEYKYIPNTVHGEFKTTLDFYHWGRIFATAPTLSPEFVACDPDPRIFNVLQDTDPLYAIVTNRINCIRPLPYQGIPTL